MDYLAGLARRGVLLGALRWELTRCRRYGRVMSILLIGPDLESGADPAAASHRTNQIGQLVRGSIREVDLVGKYSGSELLVLLPETPRGGGTVAAERVRSLVLKRGFACPPAKSGGLLTVSIGAAGYPEDGGSVVDLLEAAEESLYNARSQSGNRVEMAGGFLGGQRNGWGVLRGIALPAASPAP